MSSSKAMLAAGCALLLLAAGAAHAQEADQDAPSADEANDPAMDGASTPFLHGPLGGGRAAVSVTGGWDAATHSPRADASGWIPLPGRFSLVLGAHLGASDAWRPSAGLAVALWAPREGVQSHLLVQYKAEGFSEPEGEIELTLRNGYRWRQAAVFAEASYGQDPEALERDAELATDATVSTGGFSLGVGARGRTDLGDKHERVRWDVAAGPHLGLRVAPGQSLGLAGGLSVLSLDGRTAAGVVGLASYVVVY